MLVELARGGAVFGAFEDLRESSLELPGHEKKRPVDELFELFERKIEEHAPPQELRPRDFGVRERERGLCGSSSVVRKQWPFLLSRIKLANLRVLVPSVFVHALSLRGVEQRRHDADGARRVEHVERGPVIL